MILIFLAIFVALLIWRPFRFYILSFFSDYFYEHPGTGKIFGIRYETDETWRPSVANTTIYLEGFNFRMIFALLRIWWPDVYQNRKNMLGYVKKDYTQINLLPYLDELDGKTMNMFDFKKLMSRYFILEMERIFKFFENDDVVLETFINHGTNCAILLENVVGNGYRGIWKIIQTIPDLVKVHGILGKLKNEKKTVLLVPLLTLQQGLYRYMALYRDNLAQLEPNAFFNTEAKYLLFRQNNELVIMKRSTGKANTPTNLGFGPIGYQCPGNNISYYFVLNFLAFFKNFDIKIEGNPIITKDMIPDIRNKHEIMMTFHKNGKNITVEDIKNQYLSK